MATVNIKTGRGRGTCDDIVAHLPGVKTEVQFQARVGAAKAKAIMARHHDTGAAHITLTHGKLDWFVNLVDPGGAAAAIEFGRLKGGHGTTRGVGALSGAF